MRPMSQGKDARFFVGVRHPQVVDSHLGTVSNLREVRASEEDVGLHADEDDDSEEDWQPEDSEGSVTGTPARLATLNRRLSDQRRCLTLSHIWPYHSNLGWVYLWTSVPFFASHQLHQLQISGGQVEKPMEKASGLKLQPILELSRREIKAGSS